MTGFEPPASGHPDDLLSAHLDGELGADEARWVAGHLERCPGCRDEAAELAEARSALRALPALDGAGVTESFIDRHRAVIRTGVVFVGVAAVVVGALALTAAVTRPLVAPDTDGMVAAHVGSSHDAMGAEKMDDPQREIDGPFQVPSRLGSSAQKDLILDVAYDGRDMAALIYTDDVAAVSVFQQPGRVDWSSLDGGTRFVVGDRDVWRRDGSPVVLVAQAGYLVVTVVSEDEDAARAALDDLPDGSRDEMSDHLHDAANRLTSLFSFAG